METEHDELGNVRSKRTPQGRLYEFEPDEGPRGPLARVRRALRVIEADRDDPQLLYEVERLGSSTERIRLGNGIEGVVERDLIGRVTGLAYTQDGNRVLDLHSEWDAVGNRLSDLERVAGTSRSYESDSQDRLVVSACAFPGRAPTRTEYDLDTTQNREQVTCGLDTDSYGMDPVPHVAGGQADAQVNQLTWTPW